MSFLRAVALLAAFTLRGRRVLEERHAELGRLRYRAGRAADQPDAAQSDPAAKYDRELHRRPDLRLARHAGCESPPGSRSGFGRTNAGKRGNQQGRPDDHVSSASRDKVARRRAVYEQGRQVHLASDPQPGQQRPFPARLRSRRFDGYARRLHRRDAYEARVRARHRHHFRRERHDLARAAGASAG